eukprot:c33619_g1_i1 orf=77-244(-)
MATPKILYTLVVLQPYIKQPKTSTTNMQTEQKHSKNRCLNMIKHPLKHQSQQMNK